MAQEKYGVLKMMQGSRELESIPLREQTVVLGRERSDIVLDDSEVSSAHCQIQKISEAYHIFDLHSTNGTFVNGQRIVKSRLAEGDRIRVGKSEFLFAFAVESETNFDLDLRILEPARYDLPEGLAAVAIDKLLTQERFAYLKEARISVEVSYGDGARETLEARGEMVVGRASTFGNFMKDDELSRKHARLFVDDDASIWVEDLGSTNGVVVNGVKLSRPTKILAQDVVKIGKCKLKAKLVAGYESVSQT
jgi:pSer/pThr/pTyr-binding forkhead associated (FHA) protein